jgi:hypothetical protein
MAKLKPYLKATPKPTGVAQGALSMNPAVWATFRAGAEQKYKKGNTTGEREETMEEEAASHKPVLVMITSEGQPLENEHFIDRILALPEIRSEVAGRKCRVRTFGGNPTGWDPSEKEVMMHAFSMQLTHARDYKRPEFWCTVTNPVDGRKYQVVVCQP